MRIRYAMKLLYCFLTILCVPCFLICQEFNIEHFKSIKARNIGPAGMSGRVTAIDVDLSDEDRIFVGTASGGVWLSENGGISWKPIFDDQPTQSIGAIKINQSNPDEIWVGTGEGNPRNSQNSGAGLFQSLDAGKTWIYRGLKETKVIHRIIIDEGKPGTVYVGAQGSQWGKSQHRGVYKTTDGGLTWEKNLYIGEQVGIADLVVDPSNPNKLIAAMWEFGRSPYFFNSGGPGSGMHITYDGGKNWKQITSENGLPEGELGRMGIAISASDPDIVYALVEAQKNALYKSYDGGESWTRHSTHGNIGNRPFYYSELYVDPKDENRVYSLWSYLSRSQDGGRSFRIIANYGNNVHPDHHAFWISPNDPSYLIDGNDGGLNISNDRGNTWRFITNLPVGQFYHVNVDDDFPYNVYGGMQDNGTWVGPGFTLKSGGITNGDWQEVYFGDGFDSAPKPDNNRYVYAMSQGGNLAFIDRMTGQSRFIKPNSIDTTELRYNWNAAFVLEPHSGCGLYYGSQFLHYSNDCGHSWNIISPDLTTNDTSKQYQDISGGLTIDATNAENHTTILSIEPSTLDKKVIWVGTDDGNMQITRDGTSWNKINNNIPGLPKNPWVPQIHASKHNVGEAFVVVNNYRQNDWSAYLYHTTNFGNSWIRLVDDNDVDGFVTSVIQDHLEPNLLFLGTDVGLYISFDKGNSWTKWKNGLPPVQIRDLKVQTSFDDLVIGTFGRAFWVIDDIGPFREYARTKYTKSQLKIVSATDGYMSKKRSYHGIRFIGQAEFVGDNKNTDVMMSIWVKPEGEGEIERKSSKRSKKKGKKKEMIPASNANDASKKDSDLKFSVVNSRGDTVRRFSRKINQKGLQRMSWNMSIDGVHMPSKSAQRKNADKPSGTSALPGIYTIFAASGDYTDQVQVEVKLDPRVENITASDIANLQESQDGLNGLKLGLAKSVDKLKMAKKRVSLVEDLAKTIRDSTEKEIVTMSRSNRSAIDSLLNLIFGVSGLKGYRNNSKLLITQINAAQEYINGSFGKPSSNAQIAIDRAKQRTREIQAQIDQYFETDWIRFKERTELVEFELFDLEL